MVRTHYLNLTNIFWNILDIINIVALICALSFLPQKGRPLAVLLQLITWAMRHTLDSKELI